MGKAADLGQADAEEDEGDQGAEELQSTEDLLDKAGGAETVHEGGASRLAIDIGIVRSTSRVLVSSTGADGRVRGSVHDDLVERD